MAFTGLHDVQSACASQYEFEMLTPSTYGHGSPLQGIVIVCTDQGKQGFQRPCLYLLWCQWRSVLRRTIVGAWEPGKGEATGYSLEHCGGESRDCLEEPDGQRDHGAAGPLPRKSLPGQASTFYPRLPPDRGHTHNCSRQQKPCLSPRPAV